MARQIAFKIQPPAGMTKFFLVAGRRRLNAEVELFSDPSPAFPIPLPDLAGSKSIAPDRGGALESGIRF